MTIRSCLEKNALEAPSSKALEFYADQSWQVRTYAEFLAEVRLSAVAYGRRFGLKPREENVALILPNGPMWLESYLAMAGSGICVVPINPKFFNDEVEYILLDSDSVVVTTDAEHLDMMRALAPKLPRLRAIVVVGGGKPTYDAIGSIPVYDYDTLKRETAAQNGGDSWFDVNVAKEEDVASLIYTSGTTGKPKGAMLTHGNFTADAEGSFGAFDEKITRNDSFLVILPLFHAFSFTTNFVVPLMSGSSMSFIRTLRTIGDDIRICKPTVVMSVPLLAEKIFDKIDAAVKASSRARLLKKIGLGMLVRRNIRKSLGGRLRFMIVGGAPCPRHVLDGFKSLGIAILEGYGLTECAPVVSIAGPKCAKVGTIGVKLVNIDVRLADMNDQGVGELQVRGPITMKGYWHNDAATQEAFDGEWLKTGDLAYIDSGTGLITIRGRKKSLIVNREGKNIYPEEVENRIAGDPLVADCVVVGYTLSGQTGERVGCVVHPDDDILAKINGGEPMPWDAAQKLAIAHVHARCAELADYKRVRKIVVSKTPLERTAVQKVRRVAYSGTLDE